MWEQSAGFWRARDAWAAEVQARQSASVSTKRRPPTLDGQRRKWALKAGQYLGGKRAGLLKAIQGVTIQAPDMWPEAAALIEAMPAALARELDERLSSVAFRAFREWPVSSGYSKASIFLSYEPAGASFIGKIGDSAPYTTFIRGNVARKLLGTPSRLAVAEAIQAALEAVRG